MICLNIEVNTSPFKNQSTCNCVKMYLYGSGPAHLCSLECSVTFELFVIQVTQKYQLCYVDKRVLFEYICAACTFFVCMHMCTSPP